MSQWETRVKPFYRSNMTTDDKEHADSSAVEP